MTIIVSMILAESQVRQSLNELPAKMKYGQFNTPQDATECKRCVEELRKSFLDSSSDHTTYLNVYLEYQEGKIRRTNMVKWCADRGLSFAVMQEAEEEVARLAAHLKLPILNQRQLPNTRGAMNRIMNPNNVENLWRYSRANLPRAIVRVLSEYQNRAHSIYTGDKYKNDQNRSAEIELSIVDTSFVSQVNNQYKLSAIVYQRLEVLTSSFKKTPPRYQAKWVTEFK